jgi:hypothetical protein
VSGGWRLPRREEPQADALFDVDDIPAVVVNRVPKGSIEQRFERFHADNPWVYERLRALALDMVRKGHKRVGIGMLFEVLRWQYARVTVSDDGLKLNNNLRSRYARLLMEREPELADAFETRTLKTA